MKINGSGHLVKTNPIKPNFFKAQMNVNLYVIEDYENETAFRLEQNKPKQSQFPKTQNEQKKPEKTKVSVLTMGMGIFSSFFFAAGM